MDELARASGSSVEKSSLELLRFTVLSLQLN